MNQAAVVISNFTPMSNPILFQKIPLTQEAGLHAKFRKIESSVIFFLRFADFREESNCEVTIYFANRFHLIKI